MNKTIKKLAVVGAGTAGLITAIILKKRLNIDVDVIHSANIGIIGVGEGSTEHFDEFMKFADITQNDIIKECDATFKSGILFDGWSKDPNHKYLHSVHKEYSPRAGQFQYCSSKIIIDGQNLFPDYFLDNKLDCQFLIEQKRFPINQYHFNTHKLNEFLIKVAKKNNINIIEDDIDEVSVDDNGIKYISGKKQKYFYDFYIDCTGFKRKLIGELNAKWISFSKYLKLNSAIVFPTEDEENYNFWTLAKAMNHGWLFRIPVWGRYGNGYIYDENSISKEDAKREIDEYFGYDVEIKKEFHFDPGYLESVWIKNCCAVGLSGSFVEPLEATSIGTTIQQSFLLANKLSTYNEIDIKKFNRSFSLIMENIRDFVLLHYLTDRDDTEFWKQASSVELPENLKENLETWKHRLPVLEDLMSYESGYTLFGDFNFSQILYGIKHFDMQSLKTEYNSYADAVLLEAQNIVNYNKYIENSSILISHKEYLKNIKEL